VVSGKYVPDRGRTGTQTPRSSAVPPRTENQPGRRTDRPPRCGATPRRAPGRSPLFGTKKSVSTVYRAVWTTVTSVRGKTVTVCANSRVVRDLGNARRLTFSKKLAHPYGMSRTCQWFRNPPPGAGPLFPTPSISCTKSAGVIADSNFASGPASPHAHTKPCASMDGRALALLRGLFLIRSSSSTELACGMSVHAPVSSNRHAWYAHSSVPSSSTRPSESGARRCGHLSSNTLHLLSPFLHTTMSTPRSCVG
jgi:hypothetical protein